MLVLGLHELGPIPEAAAISRALAASGEEIGDEAGAAAAQGRANERFEGLGCANPW